MKSSNINVRPTPTEMLYPNIKMAILLFTSVLFAITCSSQYYYKDILVLQQTAAQLQKYKEQKISNVKLTSFEADGEPTEGFSGTQRAQNNYTRLITTVQSSTVGASELTSIFNEKGQLLKTTDTTDGSSSTSDYQYNDKGWLTRIDNRSSSAGQATEHEVHLWTYDNKGTPTKMLRIKNDIDTTVVNFTSDENGNVTEEKSRRNNRDLPSYFYYYDANNRLTDVVSYNQKAKRLLPDFIFEYGANNRMSSMLVVPEGSSDYRKWVYEYNAAGLKVKENCFNKRKQLLGRIFYEYR